MNKNDIQRKIAAAIAPFIISSSVATLPVNAMSNEKVDTVSAMSIQNSANFNNVKGLAGIKVDENTVYVNLNNNLINTYKNVDEALKDAAALYGNNYNIFYKDCYVNGSRTVIYAISNKNYVDGWTRTGRAVLNYYDNIASTIEYGEFLAKNVNLASYKKDMRGYAYLNLGTSKEIVYIGNNDNNQLLGKYNIGLYTKNSNYYFFKKNVVDYSNKVTTIYAISKNYYENGWTRINYNELKDTDFVSTNIELANTSFDIYNKIQKSKTNTTNISYNSKIKADALKYAYDNLDSFCILTKTVNNKAIYVISKQVEVEGWTIIANDFIPSDAQILMSMEDANSYVNKNINSNDYKDYYKFYNLVNNYTYTNNSGYNFNNQGQQYTQDYNPYYVPLYGNDAPTYLPSYNIPMENLTPNYDSNNITVTNNPNTVNQYSDMESYNAVLRDQALVYGQNNYKEFYILAKSVNETVIYTLATDYRYEGWTLVGNDNIPANAYVFKNITDANNYISNLGYTKTLK